MTYLTFELIYLLHSLLIQNRPIFFLWCTINYFFILLLLLQCCRSRFQKIEDINTKENIHTTALQNLEIRCRRLVEQLTDVSGEIEKIRTSVESRNSTAAPSFDASFVRERTVSEPTETLIEDVPTLKIGTSATKRKPIVRSLTEVRPDAYIFDNGQHIEYRYDEEEEECNEEMETIPKSGIKSFFK